MNIRLALTVSSLAIFACAGCISTGSSESARTWTIDAVRESSRPGLPVKYSSTRLGSVTVLMPYDRAAFSVRRTDGTLVEDPSNRFAAAPASLLRSPTLSALAKDGRFGVVLNQSSIAAAPATVEVTVSNLSLDCRDSGSRRAIVALRLDLISSGARSSREIIASASGEGSADAASGDYTAAFSSAFDQAIQAALAALHERTRDGK